MCVYVCVCVFVHVHAQLLQSCSTVCDPMDCSPPGSSVHGILQARIPEWVAIPFSRGSSPPRDRTQVSCIAGGFFTTEPLGKPMCVCMCMCVVAKKQVFSVWAEVKKVSKSLFWHVFSKYSFSVFGKLKSVSQPYRLDSSVIVVLSLVVKNPPANAGDVRDTGLIPGSGRSSGGGHGNPLQYSCLENPMDRGACWVRVHGVAQNQTPLRRYSIHVQFVK